MFNFFHQKYVFQQMNEQKQYSESHWHKKINSLRQEDIIHGEYLYESDISL